MKLEDMKNKKELIGTTLFAVSVISAFLIAAKVAGFYVVSANAGHAVERAIDQFKPDDNNVKSQLDKAKTIADTLKGQNLFSPPAPKQNPVTTVLGILGDEALINGRWYKAGDKVADATIVAVAPTAVTVEWDGKTKVFNPIDGGASSGPSRSSRPRSFSSGTNGPQMVVTRSAAGANPRALDGAAVKKMKETYEDMSKDQKDKFKKIMDKSKERYKQMSVAERARFKTELIEKLGRSKERGGKQPVKLMSK